MMERSLMSGAERRRSGPAAAAALRGAPVAIPVAIGTEIAAGTEEIETGTEIEIEIAGVMTD